MGYSGCVHRSFGGWDSGQTSICARKWFCSEKVREGFLRHKKVCARESGDTLFFAARFARTCLSVPQTSLPECFLHKKVCAHTSMLVSKFLLRGRRQARARRWQFFFVSVMN